MKRTYLVVCVLLASSAIAQSPGSVLGNLSAPRDTPIPFTELRMNTLLEEPLKLSGQLIYASDGSLSKLILEPVRETVTISASMVRIERNGKIREVPMRKVRELAQLYSGLRALLDGDLATLKDLFEISDRIDNDNWEVELVPLSKDFKKFASSLRVSGTGSQLNEIRITNSAQEWQLMQLAHPGP